jgi:activator of HSP90 ATPase
LQLTIEKFDKIKNKKDLGFQVSVSKTFKISTETMWEFLLSEKGIHIWLGQINLNDFELQKELITKEGIEAKLTVFVPNCHLRFKWKTVNFEKQSTVELRVTNTKGKAKIIFHHTRFYKIAQQEILRSYWKNVISKMTIELTM